VVPKWSPNNPPKGLDETQLFVGDAETACGEADTVDAMHRADGAVLKFVSDVELATGQLMW
jgi:hypothetical protein